MKTRFKIFAVWCIVCILGAGAYIRFSAARHRSLFFPVHHPQAPAAPEQLNTPTPAPPVQKPLRLLVRSTALDDHYGKLAVVSLKGKGQTTHRYIDQLSCERVSYAGGTGVCLIAERGVFTTYGATIFDASFHTLATLRLVGSPSRTRVSPDGRRAAITVFIAGHSYADISMATRTLLVDTKTGATQTDLDAFTIWRGAEKFKEIDFNFWGVTFAPDSRHFYASLASGKKIYLIKGDADAREARVIHEGVECPSLSPDSTRVAFKKRFTSGTKINWRLAVLDLASLQETILQESRSVDEQVEWLDNQTLLYAMPENDRISSAGTETWALAADASAPPRKLLTKAYSPVVF